MAATKKPAKRTEEQSAWTDDEVDAMKERARELKAAKRKGPSANKVDGEAEILAKIAEMPAPDRAMAERIHAVITSSAPTLELRTWYGMPAYAKDGKVLCFFQPASKFKARYSTFGFNDDAKLDDGTMWPTSWALTELTTAGEAAIAALVKKAAS